MVGSGKKSSGGLPKDQRAKYVNYDGDGAILVVMTNQGTYFPGHEMFDAMVNEYIERLEKLMETPAFAALMPNAPARLDYNAENKIRSQKLTGDTASCKPGDQSKQTRSPLVVQKVNVILHKREAPADVDEATMKGKKRRVSLRNT